MNRFVLGAALFAAAPAFALQPQDFATGLDVQVQAGRPVQQIDVPDAAYAAATRADLSDLRVFNAAGVAVPHALCAGAAQLPLAAPVVSDVALPVFALRAGAAAASGSAINVQVQAAGGADVHVTTPANPAALTEPGAAGFVVDASKIEAPLRALRVAWETADGASVVQVRVEASDDLDRWNTVVGETTLLKADSGDASLERVRIPLPEARYTYLRLQRADAGPAPRLERVTAEALQRPPVAAAPFTWIDARPLPLSSVKTGFLFDAQHLAPVASARIVLPAPNMTLRVALQSRPNPQAPWTTAWSGEVFELVDGGAARRSADPLFTVGSDRWWRLLLISGAESLGELAPSLQLGYRPQTLRFLAQGDGPFLLAVGSSRAGSAAPQRCEDLLAQVPERERSALLGSAIASAAHTLAGDAAKQPPKADTPARLIVLWVVLIFGSAILLAMALSVLRRIRA